jgi:hypothetical protein
MEALCKMFGIHGISYMSTRIMQTSMTILHMFKELTIQNQSLDYMTLLSSDLLKGLEVFKRLNGMRDFIHRVVQLGNLLIFRRHLISALKGVHIWNAGNNSKSTVTMKA